MLLYNLNLQRNSTCHNTGFASGGVTRKLEALCFYSSSVQVDSFVLLNPPERKAPNRYVQYLNNAMLTLGKLKEISFNELSQIFEINFNEFRLEEYEYDKTNNLYKIVVSFLIENPNIEISPLKLSLGGLKYERVYKNVILDQDGNFIKFTIHNA